MRGSSEIVQPIPAGARDARTGDREATRGNGNAMSNVAWMPQGNMEEAEWLATGRRLGAIGRGSQWWIGDWIRHGAARWGDRFSEAARATGYDRATLRNMAWIASRVDASRRNDKLSWDHHVLVASLGAEEQEHWLTRAAEERFSVADLKLELRTRRQGEYGRDADKGADEARGGAVCPNCGHHTAAD
jgi:hypothetical protein